MFVVYRIYNKVNGKSYIGMTRRLKQRLAYHQYELGHGYHHNNKLQAAYNEYGKEAFTAEILEIGISQENADIREMHWIAYFNSYEDGYNGTKGRESSRWGRQKKSS